MSKHIQQKLHVKMRFARIALFFPSHIKTDLWGHEIKFTKMSTCNRFQKQYLQVKCVAAQNRRVRVCVVRYYAAVARD
jgi:hypothetical protein